MALSNSYKGFGLSDSLVRKEQPATAASASTRSLLRTRRGSEPREEQGDRFDDGAAMRENRRLAAATSSISKVLVDAIRTLALSWGFRSVVSERESFAPWLRRACPATWR
jgi:hypothetical protein